VSGDLEGRVALVTGAGAGVGVGIAEVLAAKGARVVVNDLRPERAVATAAAIDAVAVPFDVTDLDAVRAGVAQIEAEVGPVDVLVNNAGIPADGFVPAPFLASGPEDWNRFVALNLYGVMNLALATLPGMCERGWGRVVTISSDAGRVGSPMGLSLYGASKAGALGWMRHVAHEVGPWGGTGNADSLGVMGGGGMPPVFALGLPVPRLGEPDDVGHAVAFLASDEAAWITGETVRVDGGLLSTGGL
jgi:3-oxoacyl-[acyl-carrier protein] reductase